MAEGMGGKGLLILEAKLDALVENPKRLERARRRLSISPPWYQSPESGNTTQSPSPPNEEERERERRRWEIQTHHMASKPAMQFYAQTREEVQRIVTTAVLRGEHRPTIPNGNRLPWSDEERLAEETVKRGWVEQGIWKDEWIFRRDRQLERLPKIWRHEDPLEPGSNIHLKAEEKMSLERRQDASRPMQQFVHQVSKECERLLDGLLPENVVCTSHADIKSKAYENIRALWIRRGIWDVRWSTIPGREWKHERPFEEVLAEELAYDESQGVKEAGARERINSFSRKA